ncbi:sulfate transporter CysZ [Marinomonas sp. 15G1-11]|uniref:Sulfate transporter CysZ n=1 Tax=Marinomonas phaeophyticola TaxID=3004091 RepID=A0ABT4JWC2_9GAMM|nr:sulfate transporter CysZ [Marinomonas sp. 15G1-11]MCZ2722682.1 sulfate transporter CysZ [Marinomonas sp. 15G1-11]
MILHPFKAVGSFLKALPLLFSSDLRLFVLAPLLANFALMAILYMFAFGFLTGMTDSMMSWLPGWLSFLDWLFYALFGLVSALLMFYGFSVGVNILAAPFMGILAEKVEEKLTGNVIQEQISLAFILSIVGHSILRELQKLAYFLPRVILLFIISFIPVVNVIAPILWLLFSAWMLSIQYLDYSFDNNKRNFRDMRASLRRKPILCWSFGFIVMVLLTIPLVNLFVMPLAVVAATCIWIDAFKPDTDVTGNSAMGAR